MTPRAKTDAQVNESGRWVSIAEAARYFGLKKKTEYSLASRGQLPGGRVLRFGHQIRVDISSIEAAAVKQAGKR